MKNFNDYLNVEELSYQEMIKIDGGTDNTSLCYRIGYAIGKTCGIIEASFLKIGDALMG